jgi:hypothetical protein
VGGAAVKHPAKNKIHKIITSHINALENYLNFVLFAALKALGTEHRSVAMEDGDKVQRTEPNDLPTVRSHTAHINPGDTPISKTLALAAAAAAVALGSSFAGTSSAEAGYYGKRHFSYGYTYGYKHFHYKPHYVYKRVYKPVYVYRPAYVYRPYGYSYGYKAW